MLFPPSLHLTPWDLAQTRLPSPHHPSPATWSTPQRLWNTPPAKRHSQHFRGVHPGPVRLPDDGVPASWWEEPRHLTCTLSALQSMSGWPRLSLPTVSVPFSGPVLSPRAALTQCLPPAGPEPQRCLSYRRLGDKPQAGAGLVPPEAAPPGMWTAVLSLCPHTAVPLYASASKSSLPVRSGSQNDLVLP